jgi:uncharacterized FlaG/YvyC family protein
MDPAKPIEGIIGEAQGHGVVLAETLRTRYRQQRAEEMPAIEAGEDAEGVQERRQQQPKQEPSGVLRHTYAEFEVNQDNREVTVRIIDSESGELIRTIPPEELAREIVKGNLCPNQLRRRAVLV